MSSRRYDDVDRFAPLRASADDRAHRVAIGKAGNDVLRCEAFRPLIVFGPQRSGKTTGVVIPALLDWDGPSLVTSVRLDVVEATVAKRAESGRVSIFDPAGLVQTSEPELADHCVGWSPLDGIMTWDDAVRRSFGLAEGSDQSGKGVQNGEFWVSQARMLMSAVLFAAARTGGRMRDVLDWIALPAADLVDEVCLRLETSEVALGPAESADWELCVQRLSSFEGTHEETFSGIGAQAASILEVFAYSEIEARCAVGGLSLSDFFNGNANTLYMCAPPDEQLLFKPLFTSLVREVVRLAYQRNKGRTNRLPLMLCLDEAGNVARLDDLHVIATTAAGTDIQLISVFHDMSQLYACYDEKIGRLIVNNHSGKVFLPGNSDPETISYLVSLLANSQVQGLDHTAWSNSDLRELASNKVLCLYGQLPPILLEPRRYQDGRLA